MPTVSIAVDWRAFQQQSDALRDLTVSMHSLEPHHRKLVAEMIMVRLFLLGENSISSVCEKLLSGAEYLDGTSPKVLTRATSRSNAVTLMKSRGRGNPKRHLSWVQSREIRDNLRYTLQPSDPAFGVFIRNGARLTEMRYVRNHIVHKSSSTRDHFRNVVRNYYGGLKRGITPGVLLLTHALGAPPLVERYIGFYRILMKDLVRA